nr:protein SENESCENCE-ASSOCIATED GENE 21, mitochondrial-like [Ipomoea trifida]
MKYCIACDNRRGYTVAAERVKAQAVKRAAVESPAAGEKAAAEKEAAAFWMRDPKSGNWVPETHFDDVDPADLRKQLLPRNCKKENLYGSGGEREGADDGVVIVGDGREAKEFAREGGASKENAMERDVFWMRDPKTGNSIPEIYFHEIDIAELRNKLLPCKPN